MEYRKRKYMLETRVEKVIKMTKKLEEDLENFLDCTPPVKGLQPEMIIIDWGRFRCVVGGHFDVFFEKVEEVHENYWEWRNACDSDECWYQGNINHLGELDIYRFENGDNDTIHCCDVCRYSNIPFPEDGKVRLDISEYPDSIKVELRQQFHEYIKEQRIHEQQIKEQQIKEQQSHDFHEQQIHEQQQKNQDKENNREKKMKKKKKSNKSKN